MSPCPKWAVRLYRDTSLHRLIKQLTPIFERTELHLIDDRWTRSGGEHGIELGDAEVGNANRSRMATFAGELHPRPCPGRSAGGPVNEVQIDVVEPEPVEASLDFGGGVLPTRKELRRHEHLVARHAAFAQGPPDAFLVAVRLSGVDVPVTGLERPSDGVDASHTVRDLPNAEPENRHLLSVGERAIPINGSFSRHRNSPHIRGASAVTEPDRKARELDASSSSPFDRSRATREDVNRMSCSFRTRCSAFEMFGRRSEVVGPYRSDTRRRPIESGDIVSVRSDCLFGPRSMGGCNESLGARVHRRVAWRRIDGVGERSDVGIRRPHWERVVVDSGASAGGVRNACCSERQAR